MNANIRTHFCNAIRTPRITPPEGSAVSALNIARAKDAEGVKAQTYYAPSIGERMLSADMVRPEEEKLADAYTRAAYAAIERDVKPAKKGTRRLFLDLEPQGEDDESVYAYFVFRLED